MKEETDGIFQAKTLMFRVSEGKLIVDCAGTAQFDDDHIDCTQQTVIRLEMPLAEGNLEALRRALDTALNQVKDHRI